MFCLFCTIRAEDQAPRSPYARPGRLQRGMTWLLLIVWMALVSVGVLSAVHPGWLESWSNLGATSEAIAYKRYGDALIHQGEYSKAAAQYEKSLDIDPDQKQVIVNLAVAYRHLGFDRKSAQILLRASRLDSDRDGLVAFNLGELAEIADKPAKALAYYRQAVDGMIEKDLVYRKIGNLLLQQGDHLGALDAFNRCLRVKTDDFFLYRDMLLRAQLSFAGDSIIQGVIQRQLENRLPEEDMARFDMTIVRRLQRSDPEIAKTHNHIGFIYYQLQNMDSAHEHFARSLEIWPGNSDAVSGLAAVSRMGEVRVNLGATR